MSYLDEAKPVSELDQGNLWVIWGKSGSGKTEVLSTFPKPILYLKVGDDGSNTIKHKEDIDAIEIKDLAHLKGVLKEVKKDKKYATIAVDTFGMITNEWQDENIIQKKKKMTQQAWGDLKTDSEELIRIAAQLSKKRIVVLTCHESADVIEGLEDEITPDIRPFVTRGARTYLEGMANYGIHTTKIIKVTETPEGDVEEVKYAADIGANAFYWTKLQIDSSIEVPSRIINPTYSKFMKIFSGGKQNGKKQKKA